MAKFIGPVIPFSIPNHGSPTIASPSVEMLEEMVEEKEETKDQSPSATPMPQFLRATPSPKQPQTERTSTPQPPQMEGTSTAESSQLEYTSTPQPPEMEMTAEGLPTMRDSPVKPVSLKQPDTRTPITSQTPVATQTPVPTRTPVATRSKVTPAKRYKNSLSFLLQNLLDDTSTDDQTGCKEEESSLENTSGKENKVLPAGNKSGMRNCSEGGVDETACKKSNPVAGATDKENNNTSVKIPRTASQNGAKIAPPCLNGASNRHLLWQSRVQSLVKRTDPSDTLPDVISPSSKRPCRVNLSTPSLRKTTHFAPSNYLKSVEWSPDGLSMVACSRDKVVRIYGVPDLDSGKAQVPVASYGMSNEPYDVEWNPWTSHLGNQDCNLLATCKDSPVQLLSPWTGQVLGSYTAFNHVEMMVSAFSLCYMSRDSFIAGYCQQARLFNMNRPGRDCQTMVVSDVAHQNNNSIVSALARHPGYEGTFAAGSYNTSLALYSTQIAGPLLPFHGPQRGITQLLFSTDGVRLYCGSRMEDSIYCFDTRSTSEPLYTYTRTVRTNQRLQFDIDPWERFLVTGNHDGKISVIELGGGGGGRRVEWSGHRDTVSCVSVHPGWGWVVSGSGRRHFSLAEDDEGEEDGEREENALKIWTFEDDVS